MTDLEILMHYIIIEHAGGCGETDAVNRVLKNNGWPSGLSEDSYFELMENEDEI